MDKIIQWFKTAGLRSIGYLAGGLIAKILFGSEMLLGVGIGVFLADNWVTIRNLVKDKLPNIIK